MDIMFLVCTCMCVCLKDEARTHTNRSAIERTATPCRSFATACTCPGRAAAPDDWHEGLHAVTQEGSDGNVSNDYIKKSVRTAQYRNAYALGIRSRLLSTPCDFTSTRRGVSPKGRQRERDKTFEQTRSDAQKELCRSGCRTKMRCVGRVAVPK